MHGSKLKICLIIPDNFNLDMPARPAITEIYGKYLPLIGHKVTWISPSSKNLEKIKKQNYNTITVYTLMYPPASTFGIKVLNFIKYYTRMFFFMSNFLKEESFDIIQVRNDVFSALIALHFKRKYKIPFVFQYSFPKTAFKEKKLENKYSYYFGLMVYFLQKYVLKKADLIFPISELMKEQLVKEGIHSSRMMVLPMGVNPELFSSTKNGFNVREKYFMGSSPVIIYVGTMDKLRSLDVIIHMFSRVLEYSPSSKLLMVGDGNDRPNLEELSITLGIKDNVVFTGNVPYFDIPDFIASANVCLSPIPPLDIYKVSSPTKLFEYMVMCKPVVANEEIPEQKEVIKNSGGGILVKFQPQSFANAVIELLNNPTKSKEIGEKGYNWVIENRSYMTMANSIEIRYFELLACHN